MKHVAAELAVACGALYGGLLIGILFDLFRPFHLLIRARWLHEALDILFYALAGALAGLTMLYINGGTPRLYVFISLGLGIFAYQRTLGLLIREGLSRIITKK